MDEKRFNEIDQKMQQSASNAPLFLKLNHDALCQYLNQSHCNLQKVRGENNQQPIPVKPESYALSKGIDKKRESKNSNSTKTSMQPEPNALSKNKGIHKKRESKYSKCIKIPTDNFYIWDINSSDSMENRYVGRTLFFANNKIILSGVAKKHRSLNENSENENPQKKR